MISAFAVFLASTSLSSPGLGTFFSLPSWMPKEVEAERTYGDPSATNGSLRIDAISLAAVNACFEAFCERSYYFSEGEIDSWPTSAQGPFDTTNFWFRPGPVFDYGTNRAIRTARFVETDNLIDLARALSADNLNIDNATVVRRPSWNDGSSEETRRFWSGVAIGSFLTDRGITYVLPEWKWVDNPLSGKTDNDFKGVAASWGAFGRSTPLSWTSRGAYQPDIPFMRTVLDKINFGQPPFDSEEYDAKVPQLWISTNTVMDVASSVWGEPNGPVYEWVQTNVTFTFGSVEAVENAIRNMYDRSAIRYTNTVIGVRFSCSQNWYISPGLGTVLSERDLDRVFGDYLEITARFSVWIFGGPSAAFSEYQYIPYENTVRDYRNAVRNFPLPEQDKIVSVRFDGAGSISSFDYAHYLMSQWTNQLSTITFECDRRVRKGEITDSNNQIPALTNLTRRLFSDRCAAIGQTLSLLDCSYSRVDPSYDANGTNFEYEATSEYSSGVIDVPIVWPSGYVYGDLSSVSAALPEDFGLGSLSEHPAMRSVTNTLATMWMHELPMEAHLYTGRTTQTGFKAAMDAGSEYYYRNVTERDISDFYQGFLEPDTYAVLTLGYPSYVYGFGSVSVSYYGDIDVDGVTFENQYLFGVGLDLPSVASIGVSVSPRFKYGYATGFHDNLPNVDTQSGGVHPARRGIGRVVEDGAKLWTIGDIFADIGNEGHRISSLSSFVAYDSNHSYSSVFRTFIHPFSGFDGARSNVRTHFTEFRTRFDSDEGWAARCDPWRPESVFGPMFTAFANVSLTLLKDGTSFGIEVGGFPITTPGLKPPFVPCEVIAFRIKADGRGIVSVDSVLVDRPDGEEWETPSFPYSALSVTIDIKSQRMSDDQQELPPYGYNIGTKLEHWTQTGWKWNALRKEQTK